MLKKLFGLNPNETTVRTEIMAGITTFLTMSYILAVNPNILSETGMDKGALFTATVLASAFATMVMAFYAKLPFALAPGMGLNAFFAYTICQTLGYSWQFALTAVFVEGIIFIIITATNLREKILYAIPDTIKNSISVGIGLYIAFIGLRNAGIITDSEATLVTMGNINTPSTLLCVMGIVLTSVLLVKNIKGALLFGILITTIVGIPIGVTQFNGIISAPPRIEPVFLKIELESIWSAEMFITIATMLFVDLFGSIGTIIGVSNKTAETNGGKLPRLKQAFMTDAIGTTAGALLGTSTVTTFVESATGVGEGGRSGLTAFTVAAGFLLSLFFSPFFLSIPSAATSPILILVGLMMASSIVKINFSDYANAIPAFICVLFIPFSYSISDGIIMGHLSYVFINLFSGKFKNLTVGMYTLAILFLLKFMM